MAGHIAWEEIRGKLSPEVREGIDALRTSYRLRALREARGLTQNEMAERLEIRQVSVSRMEARADVRVSTLRAVIEAMGGELQIRAVFPDAEYSIDIGADVEIQSAPNTPTRDEAREAAD
ncbi:MAG TPA: helix-turn-helix transcriptional regulator [Longimicrobium sp.]|nr:helix-turn-helix transcriptional regulator [Longimicrobium sp.]